MSFRKEPFNPGSFLGREVKLHVGCSALVKLEQLGIGSSDRIVDLVYLIEFTFACKKWVLGDHFEKHTAKTPNIHFMVIVPVSQQTFGRPVPSSGYVRCMRLIGGDFYNKNQSYFRRIRNLPTSQHPL